MTCGNPGSYLSLNIFLVEKICQGTNGGVVFLFVEVKDINISLWRLTGLAQLPDLCRNIFDDSHCSYILDMHNVSPAGQTRYDGVREREREREKERERERE